MIWTSPDKLICIVVLSSMNMVLCISQTIFSLKSSWLNNFLTSWTVSLVPPPGAPITTGITYILFSAFRFLNSKDSCLYLHRFSSRLVTMLCSISQIHIIFFSLTSNVKSGLLHIVVFLKLNSKFQTCFSCSFSGTYPLHHFCLYHFMSFSTELNSFAHEIANVISTLLCLVRYLLFANTLHPVKRYSAVSFCWPHSLHLQHLANPLEIFHDFLSTFWKKSPR